MKSLDQVNPKGRLDVLVCRIAERIILAKAPEEWPVLKPLVEQACTEIFRPKKPARRRKS